MLILEEIQFFLKFPFLSNTRIFLREILPFFFYFIFIVIIFTPLRVSNISVSWWSFTGGLSDNKSHQLSRTLLSIKADLNNAVVWIVSTRPLISKSSCPFTNLWYAYQEHQRQVVKPLLLCSTVFSITSKVEILILLFAFFQFYFVVSRDIKVHNSS